MVSKLLVGIKFSTVKVAKRIGVIVGGDQCKLCFWTFAGKNHELHLNNVVIKRHST